MQSRGPELRKFVAPELVFGVGSSRVASRCASTLGGGKALVVSNPGIVAAGWTQQVLASSEGRGIAPAHSTHVTPNPRIEDATAGAAVFAEEGCDIVVAGRVGSLSGMGIHRTPVHELPRLR
jgi:alcohol dehydrogenase class IV